MQACTIYSAQDLRMIEHEIVPDLAPDEVRIDYATGGISFTTTRKAVLACSSSRSH